MSGKISQQRIRQAAEELVNVRYGSTTGTQASLAGEDMRYWQLGGERVSRGRGKASVKKAAENAIKKTKNSTPKKHEEGVFLKDSTGDFLVLLGDKSVEIAKVTGLPVSWTGKYQTGQRMTMIPLHAKERYFDELANSGYKISQKGNKFEVEKTATKPQTSEKQQLEKEYENASKQWQQINTEKTKIVQLIKKAEASGNKNIEKLRTRRKELGTLSYQLESKTQKLGNEIRRLQQINGDS